MIKNVCSCILLLFFVSACSEDGKLPSYLSKHNSTGVDIAVYARVGAIESEYPTAKNHLRIRKSMTTVAADDLGLSISECSLPDVLFCIVGGLPLILPENTGVYQYTVNDRIVDVELSAPSFETMGTGKKRGTCDVSMMKLIVKQGTLDYEYVISKRRGVLVITRTTASDQDSWYLIAGHFIDLMQLCDRQ